MNELKILLFDIETTPIKAYIWQPGANQFISHEMIVQGERTEIITICYKYLGSKKVNSLVWDSKKSCKQMIIKFKQIVEGADLCIGHNADNFDIKHINAQSVYYGISKIDWPTSLDTLKKIRAQFKFASNRLDYLGKTLVGAGKSPMSHSDWVAIKEKNCQKSLKKMVKYCKNDVQVLEDVYKQTEPYFKPNINISIFKNDNKDGCPRCGSLNIAANGTRVNTFRRMYRYRCVDCGHSHAKTKPLIKDVAYSS